MNDYVPPTLEQSGSVSIAPLRYRHDGATCYIVGRGASLAHLRAHQFGPGFVIVINDAIASVQAFGLPNQIYSMQKEGCVTEDPDNIPRPCSTCSEHNYQRYPIIDPPPGIAVIFSQHFGSWCLHGRRNRFVFTDAELGYPGLPNTMSALEAVPLALYMGAVHIVMMCFDHVVNGDSAYIDDYPAELREKVSYNLDWLKPRLLKALADVPHSFFIPVEE